MSGKDSDIIDDSDGPFGSYDAEVAETDLWFSPQPEQNAPDVAKASLLPFAAWRGAEAALAVDLARMSFDLGRLAERRLWIGEVCLPRLAQAEAVSLSWWLGTRISADRLALWLGNRIGAMGEDAEGLVQTAWAARRLQAARTNVGPRAGLAQGATLGPLITAHLGFAPDTAAARTAEDAGKVLAALAGLHPVTLGCAGFHLWRALSERPDPLRDIEAAVLGARLGWHEAGAGFLPLSLTSFAGLGASGSPQCRLAAWIGASHQAVLAALMQFECLLQWKAKAMTLTTDLSGRTPIALIAALMRHPMITAPQAEAETGASRAAVQRNLAELTTRGLVREVTGQGRFRVWAALC